MSDRFKFRFWNKKNNAYIKSNKLIYNDGTYTQVGTKQMNNGLYHSYIVNEYNTFDIIPEQCTGLKDKNGKLIYEGDIVEVSKAYENGIYKIEFCQADCEYNLYNEDGNFIYQLTKNMANFIEVIGNIHENPELLEVQDD